jgi:HTH-type transcriptional regulator, sugar sensing transcriptional regulator
MTTSDSAVVDRLTKLGFSVYESRTYVGLLMLGTATGYSVANETGVPQPKVYETLRRLAERGAAIQTSDRPVRYTAVPADVLLANLDQEFAERLKSARDELAAMSAARTTAEPRVVWRYTELPSIVECAREMIRAAESHVYLSGRAADLALLSDAIAEADEGVEFTILHFGRLSFSVPAGRVFPHASTDAVLYPSRQAHHLAMVVDSHESLWALARDGKAWEAVRANDLLQASVVKSYIRHDIFVQRIYADLPAELEERYGKGLMRLAELSPERDRPLEQSTSRDTKRAVS